jgi:hypothetical protein
MNEILSESGNLSHEIIPDRPPEQVKLEIGHNGLPGYELRRIKSGDLIYTVDPESDVEGAGHNVSGDMERLRHGYAREEGQPYEHIPLYGDGRELPFPDDSVGEVLFSNVISDPYIEDVGLLLKEALRVGRTVIVNDQITPGVSGGRLNPETLKSIGATRRTLEWSNEKDRDELIAIGLDGLGEEVHILTKAEMIPDDTESQDSSRSIRSSLGRAARRLFGKGQ